MNPLIFIILLVFSLWMTFCALCGYRAAFLRFVIVLGIGLFAIAAWMVTGLKADLFSTNAMSALFSGFMFACACFGAGWLVGRFVRQWQASRVDQP